MDLLFDILFEVYLELMMLIVPEEKAATKKYRIIAMLIASLVMVIDFALFILGGTLIFDEGRLIGILPLSLAAVLSLAQIVLGIVFSIRKHK